MTPPYVHLVTLLLFAGAATAGESAPAIERRIPNQTYPANQVFTAITKMEAPFGATTDAFVGGVVWGRFWTSWDMSDPLKIRQIGKGVPKDAGGAFKQLNDHNQAYAIIDGRLIACKAVQRGMAFFDLTDRMDVKPLGSVDIGYGNDDAKVFWQGNHVYVGMERHGLAIVDARDVARPRLVHRLPSSVLGLRNIAPIHAVGNVLYVPGHDQNSGLLILDIGDPHRPRLLHLDEKTPGHSYDVDVGNGICWVHGRRGLYAYDVADPRKPKLVGSIKHSDKEWLGGNGETLVVQDGHVHFTNVGGYYYRVDARDPARLAIDPKQRVDANAEWQRLNATDPRFQKQGSRDKRPGDLDFLAVIGNLALPATIPGRTFVIPHQSAPDREPPLVTMVGPPDKAVDQPSTTRVSVVLSDGIDLRTVNTSTVIIRAVGGKAIPGRYVYQANTVSFEPDAPFQADRTYEVVVPAGGVTDLCGNAIAKPFASRFSIAKAQTTILALPAAVLAAWDDRFLAIIAKLADQGKKPARLFAWRYGNGDGFLVRMYELMKQPLPAGKEAKEEGAIMLHAVDAKARTLTISWAPAHKKYAGQASPPAVVAIGDLDLSAKADFSDAAATQLRTDPSAHALGAFYLLAGGADVSMIQKRILLAGTAIDEVLDVFKR